MKNMIFATALAFALPAAAGATITTFSGQDDGAPVGGTFTNSDAAAANFYAAALPYAPLVTTGFETIPVGFSHHYALPDATLHLTAGDYGPLYSGVTNAAVGLPYDRLYGFDVGTGSGNWLGFYAGSATFSFNGLASHAFGFYATGTQDVFGHDFFLTIDNDPSQAFLLPVNVNGGVQFFGLVDTDAFHSITIWRPRYDAWGVDNVSYGVPQGAAPEPASWALMLCGFGLVGGAMRGRRTVSFA